MTDDIILERAVQTAIDAWYGRTGDPVSLADAIRIGIETYLTHKQS